MIVNRPNETATHFRIRSIQRPFFKTDTFTKYNSSYKRKTLQSNPHSNIKRPFKNIPLPKNLPQPETKKPEYFKRLIPKRLRLANNCVQADSLNKCQKQLVDPISFPEIPVTYQSLLFQNNHESTYESNCIKAFWPVKSQIVMVRQIKSESKKQLNLLKNIKHQNLLEVLGSQFVEDSIYFYIQYMKCGSLRSMLNSIGPLSFQLIKKIGKQVIGVVGYLHEKGLIHGDIRAQKIFFDEEGNVKLSFPISELKQNKNENENKQLAQVIWKSPETIFEGVKNEKSDVWAIGCLILQMMTGEKLCQNQSIDSANTKKQFNQIVENQKIRISKLEGMSPGLKLVDMCLQSDPKNRRSIQQLSRDQFFFNI